MFGIKVLMVSPMRLVNRVRELRRRLGLRQEDLAREVGLSRQSIIALERGRLRNPSVQTCLKIAQVLRTPLEQVFYLVPTRPLAAASALPAEGSGGKAGAGIRARGGPEPGKGVPPRRVAGPGALVEGLEAEKPAEVKQAPEQAAKPSGGMAPLRPGTESPRGIWDFNSDEPENR